MSRIATLGEEVRDPGRVVPRAVIATGTVAPREAVAWALSRIGTA